MSDGVCDACGGTLVIDCEGPHEYVCVECGKGAGRATSQFDMLLTGPRSARPIQSITIEEADDDESDE